MKKSRMRIGIPDLFGQETLVFSRKIRFPMEILPHVVRLVDILFRCAWSASSFLRTYILHINNDIYIHIFVTYTYKCVRMCMHTYDGSSICRYFQLPIASFTFSNSKVICVANRLPHSLIVHVFFSVQTFPLKAFDRAFTVRARASRRARIG